MTKIDIFSGFLGAGKTTLIKKLLQGALQGEKVVLIENEFGEIGIDGGFLKETGIEITEMNSGCICCTLVGDFERALKEVLEKYAPTRVIIEPSGVGKLSDVIQAVSGVIEEGKVELNAVVTVADGSKCKMYMKNFGEFYNNQIESAKTIVLSRTFNMSQSRLEDSVRLIRDKNKEAAIVTTPLEELDASSILEVIEHGTTDISDLFFESHEHVHHHADDVFVSWGIETTHKFTQEEIRACLTSLSHVMKYGIVLRAKGIVPSNEGDWIHFDYVPDEIQIRRGGSDYTGRLCVIGSKLVKEALSELFCAY